MLRYLTAGESHGRCLTAIIEGLPAGLPLTAAVINHDLARRQQGYGRGGRMEIERDRAEILSGLRGGETIGSPLTLQIENRDWPNWQETMAAEGSIPPGAALTRPRPGHADLAGAQKYDRTDLRDILERASARETAARVAVGAAARQLLREFGVTVTSHVLAIGGVWGESIPADPMAAAAAAAQSPVGCPDPAASILMQQVVDRARMEGDSLGGVFAVLVQGLPPGLGSHVQWDRRLDARLAGAVMSIPGIKGVEFGLGFSAAHLPGSAVHDTIGITPDGSFKRGTNHAGGLEGGMTNGETLYLRAAMKPIPTLRRPLGSVDLATLQPAQAAAERSDVCAVPAAAVVGEAVAAFALARTWIEKFGGDSLGEMQANWQHYLARLADQWRARNEGE